jgi:AAA+ ATPase superfamily predicted ATPase
VRNPFEYGGVVSGEAFCNRQKELADLRRAMENAEKLFVFSERRYGKTSLVRAALGRLPRKNFISAYVDLWPTDSEGTFVAAMARAITESMSSSVEKALETAKKLFGSLSPSVTVNEEGKPTLAFGLRSTPGLIRSWKKFWKRPRRLRPRAGRALPSCSTNFSRFWSTAATV